MLPSDDAFEKTPWKLNDQASWNRRVGSMFSPRAEPLNRFVKVLRQETQKHVPWIDPFCGASDARILLVLKRPGPRGATETDFLSLANTDRTALNTIDVMQDAGIEYRQVTFWNAIPWSGDRKEVITSSMLEKGASMFQRLLPLLPKIKYVILLGREAQRICPMMRWPRGVRPLMCAHPTPIVWNQHRFRTHKESIYAAFRTAAIG